MDDVALDAMPPCVGHVWRLDGVQVGGDFRVSTTYVCVRCDAPLYVGPGEVPPDGV